MKEKTRLKLKIISSFATCLLSLFSLVALTLSWFAYNDRVDGNGMSVVAKNDRIFLGCEYYRLENKDGGYALTQTDAASASLGVYDAMKDDYALIVKLYFKRDETSDAQKPAVTVSAETNTKYFLGDNGKTDGDTTLDYKLLPPLKSLPAQPADEGKGYTNALSSVVTFTALTVEEIEDMSDGVLSSLPSGDRFSTFVDVDATNANGIHEVKNSSKISSKKGGTAELYEEQYNGQDCYSACVYVTYDPLLINTVFSANIGNDDMLSENEKVEYYPVPFKCDFWLSVDFA